MNILLPLIKNFGLLLALTYVCSLVSPKLLRLPLRWQNLGLGLIFGFFGLIAMLLPVKVGDGILIDGRDAMIVMATLYGGLVGGLASLALAIPTRLLLGGIGVSAGIPSMICAVLLTLWYRRRFGSGAKLSQRRLVELGILVTLQFLAWLLLLPDAAGQPAIQQVALPLLVITPLAIVLLGSMLSHEAQHATLERAVSDSEARFQQIAEASDQVFWIYEPDSSTPVYISPAFEKVWGRKADDICNKASLLRETIHPEDRDRIWDMLTYPASTNTLTQCRIIRADGEVRWVSARMYPVMNAQGQLHRIVGLAEDVTDHKFAEEHKLDLEIERERGAMLRQFISDASHDLRTPITIMHTSLYLLGRTLENDRQKQYAGQVQTQVNRMTRLIEDMLAISELDTADLPFEQQPVSVKHLVEEAYRRRQPEARAKERTLNLNLSDETLWIMADESKLAEAIDRVMKNAIAYTTMGDTVTISSYRRDQNAIIEVTDTGVGIPEGDLPYIFQRFYRADKARGTDFGGAGLGLSIARKIVELHRGDIEAESTLGKGSSFRFVLPLTTLPEALHQSEALPAANAVASCS
jgi:PAS domain S-box-containing protein